MTANNDEIISIVESLPIEFKTKIIDKLWGDEPKKRLKEINSGSVKTIPANEVFEEISKDTDVENALNLLKNAPDREPFEYDK